MLTKPVPETCTKLNTTLFGASFLYQKLTNQSNRTVLMQETYASFWYKFLVPNIESASPMRQRVLFKIAVLVYQCLNGLAPSYLADDCQLVSDVRLRRLRSSDSGLCAVRRTHITYGDRCFAVAGPRLWNFLPTELRQSDSLGQFKR